MRWIGAAGLGLMLACAAEAQVQPAQFIGSWVCDAYTRSDPRGIDLVMQINPAFEANGRFADTFIASVSGNSSSGDAHTLSARLSAKGVWTLEGDVAWLKYEEAVLSELVIDGQAADTAPYQKQLVDLIAQPHANPARIMGEILEVKASGQSIACRRRGESDPS